MTNLHKRREKIAVGKVGNEAGLVCTANHGDGRSDSFQPEANCINVNGMGQYKMKK
jgi:hypothetical protein